MNHPIDNGLPPKERREPTSNQSSGQAPSFFFWSGLRAGCSRFAGCGLDPFLQMTDHCRLTSLTLDFSTIANCQPEEKHRGVVHLTPGPSHGPQLCGLCVGLLGNLGDRVSVTPCVRPAIADRFLDMGARDCG